MTARYRFQLRRGTTAEWAGDDPILLDGEPAFDESDGTLRIGDGVRHWSALPAIGAGGGLTVDDVQALIDGAVAGIEDTNGAPDIPATNLYQTDDWVNLIGGSWSWGTGGTARIRHSRIGRLVAIGLEVKATADHSTGIPFLPDTALPYPEIRGFRDEDGVSIGALGFTASGFGFVSVLESSSGAGDGGAIPLGPAIISGQGLLFMQMSGRNNDGQIGALWATDGQAMFGVDPPYTIDTTGKGFELYAGFVYEAAEALS